MRTPATLTKAALCVLTLLCAGARAQTAPPAGTAPPPKEQPGAVSADPVANEIALLRKSLQTLNARLREITEKVFAPDAVNTSGAATPAGKQSPLAQNLDILSRAEQRAEGLRRQLLEMTEKETAYRTRMMQLDDDMRPDSIDRSLSGVGTTRMQDLRDLRRRQLDNERRGVEMLLNQTAAARARLEEDLKQADFLVARIRQRLLPLIEKEIDKLPAVMP